MSRHCDDCRFRITSYRWRYDVREQIRSARSARRISNRAVKFGSISTGRTARSQVMNWKAPSLPCNVISMSVSTPLSNAHETDGVGRCPCRVWALHGPVGNHTRRGGPMITLGIILLILGAILKISVLWTIGIILTVIGLILAFF